MDGFIAKLCDQINIINIYIFIIHIS